MTLSDKTWIILTAGLATAVVGLMGGQIDYGIRANALTRTALSSAAPIEPASSLAASRFNRISQGEPQ